MEVLEECEGGVEAKRDSAQNRVSAVTEVSIRVESALQRRWDAEYLVLLDGKAAFPQVAQQLALGLKGDLRAAVVLRQRYFVTLLTARLRVSLRCAPREPISFANARQFQGLR